LVQEGRTFTLAEERIIGKYAVRLWRSFADSCMFGLATISAEGQPSLQISDACSFGDLPMEDVTGEGDPDVLLEILFSGSRQSPSRVIYNLGATPSRVLYAPFVHDNGGGDVIFEDLDGDGRMEVLTNSGGMGRLYCSGMTMLVVLQYQAGRGYVPVTPHFAYLYADRIARATQRLDEAVARGDQLTGCGVQELILAYLYSGRPDLAWAALARYYTSYTEPSAADVRAQIEQAVAGDPLFVAATLP
jgi:hypothetical protein